MKTRKDTMLDLMNMGSPQKIYPETPIKEMESSPDKYISIAKRLIMANAPKLRLDFAHKILASEDAVSNIATVVMLADWRWNGKGTREGYRKEWVKYALLSMLTRSVKNQRRAMQSLDFDDGEGGVPLGSTIASTVKPPDYMLTLEEESKKVKDLLNIGSLSDTQRKCITMYYLEDMTLTQVGQQLSITREAVRQSINRGLSKIRKAINGHQ